MTPMCQNSSQITIDQMREESNNSLAPILSDSTSLQHLVNLALFQPDFSPAEVQLISLMLSEASSPCTVDQQSNCLAEKLFVEDRTILKCEQEDETCQPSPKRRKGYDEQGGPVDVKEISMLKSIIPKQKSFSNETSVRKYSSDDTVNTWNSDMNTAPPESPTLLSHEQSSKLPCTDLNCSLPPSMPVILTTIEEEIKKTSPDIVPTCFRFFCLGLLTAMCGMSESSASSEALPEDIKRQLHTLSADECAITESIDHFFTGLGSTGAVSLFADGLMPQSAHNLSRPDFPPMKYPSVQDCVNNFVPKTTCEQQNSLPLLYSTGILQQLLNKNSGELSQRVELAAKSNDAIVKSRGEMPNVNSNGQNLNFNVLTTGFDFEVQRALSQAINQQMGHQIIHRTEGSTERYEPLRSGIDNPLLKASSQPQPLAVRYRKRKAKGDRTPPDEFLVDFVDLLNEGLSENEIREYYRSCGSDLLPMYFTVDKNTIRYRNIENGIKIWLKINEELVFGLLVASMLDVLSTERMEHLRPSLLRLDKRKLLDAARHWEDRALKASRENYLKILDSVNRALEFCSIEPILIRGSYYVARPPSDTRTSEEIVRGLLQIKARKPPHFETEVNNYLISLGPSPLPPQFCFTRSSMRVHYRNSQRKLYVTLSCNEELILGLLIAAMISNPVTEQFNEFRSEIQQLDRSFMVTVIKSFKEKSPPGITLYRVNSAAEALHRFVTFSCNGTIDTALPVADSSLVDATSTGITNVYDSNEGP